MSEKQKVEILICDYCQKEYYNHDPDQECCEYCECNCKFCRNVRCELGHDEFVIALKYIDRLYGGHIGDNTRVKK
jgi:hypothetical protein